MYFTQGFSIVCEENMKKTYELHYLADEFYEKYFKKYLSGYNDYISCTLNEFESKKYQYSTLKYFLNK